MHMGILYLCFFISGVAALVYEVLWSKYLALCLGSTGMAQVIVLATFMGGMALGSHILGRIADRVKEPLRFYACLEFAIAVYALLFHHVFVLMREAFIVIARAADLSGAGMTAGKIFTAVGAILIPSFLMGGTLPAMSRHVVRRMKQLGPRIAVLYFLNSFGAVAGCALAGFVLISSFGLYLSMVIGSLFSIAAGLIAMWILVRDRESAQVEAPPCAEEKISEVESDNVPEGWRFGVLLACVSLSGAVSMMYEVAWIRLLTLVLGSSTYSFSIMLCTFILGLSLGGLFLSFRKKTSGYALIFGLCEASVGLLVLLMLPFYVRLPFVFNQVASSLSREPSTFGTYQLCKFLLCALVMIVPCIMQGITLPAATKVLMKDVKTLGKRVGYIYAVNTVGTLLGAVFAGFLGLPMLGIKGTLELAAGMNCILAIAILLTRTRTQYRFKVVWASAVVMLIVWGWYFASMGSWDRNIISLGVYRIRNRVPSFQHLIKYANDRETLFYRDGVDATIAVQDTKGKESRRMLVINGKVDAATGKDMSTQKMLGHLPLILSGDVKDVLVVGIGSGCTAGAVLAHDVERVDVVEISRDVYEASKLFGHVNNRYWEDPRAHVYCEDAKTFLQVVDRQYDVIICEPTNPWIAGVAGVFSLEYFQECRKHLRAGGKFVQWMQAYELEDLTYYMMLETFSSVFPYYTMWNPEHADTIIVGSAESYRPDLRRMEAKFARQEVRQDLRGLNLDSLLPVLMMQMLDRADKYSHYDWFGSRHSDYYPKLDYLAPRGFYIGAGVKGIKWMDRRGLPPGRADLWVNDYIKDFKISREDFADTFEFTLAFKSVFKMLSLSVYREWLAQYPQDSAMADEIAGADRELMEILDNVSSEPGEDFASVQDAYYSYIYTRNVLRPYSAERILASIKGLIDDAEYSSDPELMLWAGELMLDGGDEEGAVKMLKASLSASGSDNTAATTRCMVLLVEGMVELGELRAALSVADELLRRNPNSRKAWILRLETASMLE